MKGLLLLLYLQRGGGIDHQLLLQVGLEQGGLAQQPALLIVQHLLVYPVPLLHLVTQRKPRLFLGLMQFFVLKHQGSLPYFAEQGNEHPSFLLLLEALVFRLVCAILNLVRLFEPG